MHVWSTLYSREWNKSPLVSCSRLELIGVSCSAVRYLIRRLDRLSQRWGWHLHSLGLGGDGHSYCRRHNGLSRLSPPCAVCSYFVVRVLESTRLRYNLCIIIEVVFVSLCAGYLAIPAVTLSAVICLCYSSQIQEFKLIYQSNIKRQSLTLSTIYIQRITVGFVFVWYM